MSTPEQKAQQRRTQARGDVLAYLAQRPRLSYPAATIRQRLREDQQTDYTEEEICDALAFLESTKEVRMERQHAHGTTKYYQATAEGVLSYERSI